MKNILLAIMIGTSAVVFAGGGKEQSGGSATAKKTAIDVLLSRTTQIDGLQKVMDEIEKRFGIVSEVEIRPGGAEGETIVKTRLASNAMADLFLYNTGSKTNDINPERYCLDLSEYTPKLEPAFISSASVNGKLYAVPVDYSAQAGVILYHKGIYQQLGLQIPKTWSDFLGNCAKI